MDYEDVLREELARHGRQLRRVTVAEHASRHARAASAVTWYALVVECVGEVPFYELLDPCELFDAEYLRGWVRGYYGGPVLPQIPQTPVVVG